MYIENFWLFVVVVFRCGQHFRLRLFYACATATRAGFKNLQDQLDAKTEELEVYREDVSEHFLQNG